jgi:hypothetical protein
MVAKYPKKIYLNWLWEITIYTKLSRSWEITHHKGEKKKGKYFKLHWVTGHLALLSIECSRQKIWLINKMAKFDFVAFLS